MRGFIEELRHRNVFRVGIAYVITGWLLAQVADLVVDAFNLPDAFLQMVIILLLFGFPVSLFFAWAFELTPDGVKKAKDLPADMPKDPRSGKQLNRLTIVTLLFAVAWLGWDKLQDPAEAPAPETAVTDKSIAVLPFADFSPGGDQAWFADGLTDEILNALGFHVVCHRLAAQRALGLGDRDFALEVRRDPLEPQRRIGLSEQQGLFFGGQRERRGDHVCEQARTGDSRDEVLPLVGVIVVEIDDAMREADHLLPQRIHLVWIRLEILEHIEPHPQCG